MACSPPSGARTHAFYSPHRGLVACLQREREGVEADDRKRAYNSLAGQDVDVSAEEMEAWRIKRSRGDDPLAFIDKEKGKQDGYDFV